MSEFYLRGMYLFLKVSHKLWKLYYFKHNSPLSHNSPSLIQHQWKYFILWTYMKVLPKSLFPNLSQLRFSKIFEEPLVVSVIKIKKKQSSIANIFLINSYLILFFLLLFLLTSLNLVQKIFSFKLLYVFTKIHYMIWHLFTWYLLTKKRLPYVLNKIYKWGLLYLTGFSDNGKAMICLFQFWKRDIS